MNIFITGIAGFIGTNLEQRLKYHGHNVYGIDNFSNALRKKEERANNIFPWDACEPVDDWLITDADVVIHLAAQNSVDKSWDRSDNTFLNNLSSTKEICLKACKYGKKTIIASSSEVIGERARITDRGTGPSNPYAYSKSCAESIARWAFEPRPELLTVLRPFNTYGPWHWDGVIARFARCILEDKPIPVHGTGRQARDFVYIDDVLAAYEIAMASEGGITVEIGTGTAIPIMTVARMLSDKLNKPLVCNYLHGRPREFLVQFADVETAERLIGFLAQWSLSEGLDEYLSWLKDNHTVLPAFYNGNRTASCPVCS